MQFLVRRIACLAFALLSLSFPARAQDSAPKAVAENASQAALPPARPALWKVADADTTIYLFGTIHALPQGVDWFDGEVAQAFDRSQELVTEIVQTDPVVMQQLVMQHAMLPEGQTLRGLLAPEVRQTYEAELQKLGLPAETFDGYEPWYAAVALSTLPLLRQGFDSSQGVEQTLDNRAEVLGRPHTALETAEFQIGLFDSLPMEAQQRYFAEVVKDLPKAVDQINQIIIAWKKGDAERLASLMNAEEDDATLIEMLLTGRNRMWANWLKRRMEKPGVVFVAVGAGHLAGAGSLQDQLASQGISVQRVQ